MCMSIFFTVVIDVSLITTRVQNMRLKMGETISEQMAVITRTRKQLRPKNTVKSKVGAVCFYIANYEIVKGF